MLGFAFEYFVGHGLHVGLVQDLRLVFVGMHFGKVIKRILDVNLAEAYFLRFA
jgi:hypothetical protein